MSIVEKIFLDDTSEEKVENTENLLQLEIYNEDDRQYLWIGDESGCGSSYEIKNKEDLVKAFAKYVVNYL